MPTDTETETAPTAVELRWLTYVSTLERGGKGIQTYDHMVTWPVGDAYPNINGETVAVRMGETVEECGVQFKGKAIEGALRVVFKCWRSGKPGSEPCWVRATYFTEEDQPIHFDAKTNTPVATRSTELNSDIDEAMLAVAAMVGCPVTDGNLGRAVKTCNLDRKKAAAWFKKNVNQNTTKRKREVEVYTHSGGKCEVCKTPDADDPCRVCQVSRGGLSPEILLVLSQQYETIQTLKERRGSEWKNSRDPTRIDVAEALLCQLLTMRIVQLFKERIDPAETVGWELLAKGFYVRPGPRKPAHLPKFCIHFTGTDVDVIVRSVSPEAVCILLWNGQLDPTVIYCHCKQCGKSNGAGCASPGFMFDCLQENTGIPSKKEQIRFLFCATMWLNGPRPHHNKHLGFNPSQMENYIKHTLISLSSR